VGFFLLPRTPAFPEREKQEDSNGHNSDKKTAIIAAGGVPGQIARAIIHDKRAPEIL
jgi:hypothetical protein